MESTPSEINTEHRPIYKPPGKYNLQEAIGLKNEKQRWLAYLEILRECTYEKNVNFSSNYRSQKQVITAQIVRSFKKKAPDFPVTAGDWAIKEMLVSMIQNKRYYLKRKRNELEDNLRILQDYSPPSPQAQDPPSPVELPEPRNDEQVQINPSRRIREQCEKDKENQNNVPKKKAGNQRSQISQLDLEDDYFFFLFSIKRMIFDLINSINRVMY